MMTGPAEWEFSGTFDPASGDWSRDLESRSTADTSADKGAA
jgi:diaminopimelate epimerase